jgi:hypothetical protein
VGCHQKGGTWHHSFFKKISFGVNYNKTFALIVKFVSIRCILALTTIQSMEIHQMNVKTIILNGDLERKSTWNSPKDSHKEAISVVSQHMANPNLEHQIVVKHIF